MAQDLSDVKSNFATQCTDMAARLLQLGEDCDQLLRYWFAHGLNAGAANEFVEDDLVGGNAHLTPTAVVNIVTAANAVKAALDVSGVRDNLARGLFKPLG